MRHNTAKKQQYWCTCNPFANQKAYLCSVKTSKICHTNIITIIITMKTKRHARAACIRTNIITITTTNMMKKVIINTTIIMKRDIIITTIMTKVD